MFYGDQIGQQQESTHMIHVTCLFMTRTCDANLYHIFTHVRMCVCECDREPTKQINDDTINFSEDDITVSYPDHATKSHLIS